MVDYGKVRSAVRPEPISIDDFSVWVHSDVKEVEDGGFVGFEYNMTRYGKDEYISLKATESDNLSKQLTDVQLALCELYEGGAANG